MSSVTVPAPKTTLKFMGWSLAQGTDASEQEGDTVGSRPLLNNGVVEFTEDTDVYPVYYSGIWIVFVSADTGMGATYVPSYFISADSINASAAKPTDPAMTGYEFDGWFTAPESKEDYIPAETGGSFNFNTSFEDLAGYTNDRGEVVLYGHWKGGERHMTMQVRPILSPARPDPFRHRQRHSRRPIQALSIAVMNWLT